MHTPPDNDYESRVDRQAPAGKERADMRADTNSAIMVAITLRPITYSDSVEKAFRTLVDNFGVGFDVVSLDTACRSSSFSVRDTPLRLAMCSKTCGNIQQPADNQ
jgi:hypothetical protein